VSVGLILQWGQADYVRVRKLTSRKVPPVSGVIFRRSSFKATAFSPTPRKPPTPMTKPYTLVPSLLRMRSLMLPIFALSGS
jgi:hypothetical protein